MLTKLHGMLLTQEARLAIQSNLLGAFSAVVGPMIHVAITYSPYLLHSHNILQHRLLMAEHPTCNVALQKLNL